MVPRAANPQREEIVFELDRLELTAADRLELSGRWYGVRGRRFVRPTLTLRADGAQHRALADLEHKPWGAEDGEAWLAAFPLDLEGERAQIGDLELAVAPDIAIPLPAPACEPPEAGDRESPRIATRAEAAKVSEAAAPAHRDAPPSKMEDVAAERDAALQGRKEALRERDYAIAERDGALREREDAIAERDQASREREAAIAERDAVARSLDELVPERNALSRACERLQRGRDAALAARDLAIERSQAIQATAESRLSELRAELEQMRRQARVAAHPQPATQPQPATRAQPDTQPQPANPPPAAPFLEPQSTRTRRRLARRDLGARRAVDWPRRAFAIVVLAVAIVALALIVHSA